MNLSKREIALLTEPIWGLEKIDKIDDINKWEIAKIKVLIYILRIVRWILLLLIISLAIQLVYFYYPEIFRI